MRLPRRNGSGRAPAKPWGQAIVSAVTVLAPARPDGRSRGWSTVHPGLALGICLAVCGRAAAESPWRAAPLELPAYRFSPLDDPGAVHPRDGQPALSPELGRPFSPAAEFTSPTALYSAVRDAYFPQYAFGIRRIEPLDSLDWRPRSQYGGPWYYPGAPTNFRHFRYRW